MFHTALISLAASVLSLDEFNNLHALYKHIFIEFHPSHKILTLYIN